MSQRVVREQRLLGVDFELGVFSLEGSREQELNSDLVDAIREAASSFH
jgi:hypothetical protein